MPEPSPASLEETPSQNKPEITPTVQVAINTHFRGKIKPGHKQFWRFNMTFQNRHLTLPDLLERIRQGYAWTAPHQHLRHHRPTRRNPNYYTTYRVKANVFGSQLLALDSDTGDERSHFDVLVEDPFIAQFGALLHATASSTIQQPRSRIIFMLEQMLPTEEYERALKALLHRFPFCDQSVNHAAVVFYGAKDCDYRLNLTPLPLTQLHKQIIEPYTAFLVQEKARRDKERIAKLAAYGSREKPAAGQVARYVQTVYNNLLTRLAATPTGQGLRHRRLYSAGLTIGGLIAAPWVSGEASQRLIHAVDDLLEAAVTNGYVAEYGEEDALRTIDNGLAQGEQNPFSEPVWYAKRPFLQVGDMATAVIHGETKAKGRVTRLRETAHWEYELDSQPNVWYAHDHLQQK